VIDGLRRERPRAIRRASPRRWPLIDREVRGVYYEALLRNTAGPAVAAAFAADFLRCPPGRDAEHALLDAYRIAPPGGGTGSGSNALTRDGRSPDRWTPELAAGPSAPGRGAGAAGQCDQPLKAALDVLRDLRNEVRLVVDHGGITGRSYRDELERWYNPLNAYTSIGPPVQRIEEMIALMEAGILHLVGPRTRIRPSAPTAASWWIPDGPGRTGARYTG